MRRDLLFVTEMIDSAEQTHKLATQASLDDLSKDRQLRDALLWNFTVLGEAATQVSSELKTRFSEVSWKQPLSAAQSHRPRLLGHRSRGPTRHRSRLHPGLRGRTAQSQGSAHP